MRLALKTNLPIYEQEIRCDGLLFLEKHQIFFWGVAVCCFSFFFKIFNHSTSLRRGGRIENKNFDVKSMGEFKSMNKKKIYL